MLLTANLLNTLRYFSEWFSVGMWREHDDVSMVMLAKITQKTVILLWLHCQLIIWHADKIFLPQPPRLYFIYMKVWSLQENTNLLVTQSTTVTILERVVFYICRIGTEQAVHLQTSCQCSSVLTSGGYFLKWEWISALSAFFFLCRDCCWSASYFLKCEVSSENYNFKIYLRLLGQNCPMYKASKGKQAEKLHQVWTPLITFLVDFSSLTLVKTWRHTIKSFCFWIMYTLCFPL